MKAEEEIIGRKVKCPRCDRVARVPEADNLERPVDPDPIGDAFEEADELAAKVSDHSSSDDLQSSEQATRLETNRPDFSSFSALRPRPNSSGADEDSGDAVEVDNDTNEKIAQDSQGEVVELFGHSAVVSGSDAPFEPRFNAADPKKQSATNRTWIPIVLIAVALVGGTYFAMNLNRMFSTTQTLDNEFQQTAEAYGYAQAVKAIEKSNRFMTTAGKAMLFMAPSKKLEEELDSYSSSIVTLTKNSTVLTDAEALFKDGKKNGIQATIVGCDSGVERPAIGSRSKTGRVPIQRDMNQFGGSQYSLVIGLGQSSRYLSCFA